jgi:hypothetical protein
VKQVVKKYIKEKDMNTTGKPTAALRFALTLPEVVLTLNDARFAAIAAGTDVSSWFTNLPAGLTAKVKNAVQAKAATITITISGTPSVGNAQEMAITIPADRLDGSRSSIKVAPNPNAKFDITAVIENLADFKAFAEAVNAGDYRQKARLADSKTVIKIPPNAPYLPIARDPAHPCTPAYLTDRAAR